MSDEAYKVIKKSHGASIQPGGPGTEIVCPNCGHRDVFQGHAEKEPSLKCDQCDQYFDYGLWRVTFQTRKLDDARFVGISVDGREPIPVLKVNARMFAMELLRLSGE